MVNGKNNRTLYHQKYHGIGKPLITLQNQEHIRIILEFFEKYKCPGFAFSLQSSRCVSNEQLCLETTGLYDDLLLFPPWFLSAPASNLAPGAPLACPYAARHSGPRRRPLPRADPFRRPSLRRLGRLSPLRPRRGKLSLKRGEERETWT